MSSSSKQLFLLATIGILLIGCLLAARIDASARVLRPEFPSEPGAAPRAATALPLDRAEAVELRRPAAASAAPVRIQAEAGDSSGRLSVSAVSAEPLANVRRIRVRAASGTRVADRTSDRGWEAVRFTLTPDSYRVLVSADGFEPVELPRIEIGSAEAVEIESVRLLPGSARILGVVTGDSEGYPGPRVELLGEGRRPCAECASDPNPWTIATPCVACGFAGRSSRVDVQDDGRFSFAGLVGGLYALRLVDGRDRALGPPVIVEVPSHGSAVAEIPATTGRTVRIELRDTDGRSLADAWRERVREVDPETVEFVEERTFRRAPPDFECTFESKGSYSARSSFAAPAPASGWGNVTVLRCGGVGRSSRRSTDDRPLRAGESLWPEAAPPAVDPIHVEAELDRTACILFEPLPSVELALRITCGPFEAEVTIPASASDSPIPAKLTTTSGKTWLRYEVDADR